MPVTVTDIYSAPAMFADFKFIISILNPGHRGIKSTGPHHLVVRMEDKENPRPKELEQMTEGVERILRWAKRVKPEDTLLVHCHQGMSRSASIAWLILASRGEDFKASFKALHRARPQIWPNVRMIGIGDSFLGLNGEMHRVAQVVNGQILSGKIRLD